MDALLLLTDPNSESQIRQIANTFGVDWPHLLAQIVSFAIVCLALQRYAYKPILRMLDERRRQIAQGVADREQTKTELANAESRRQEIMLQADAAANRVIEEAQAAAARIRETETQKAIATAEQIILKSREAALQEHARMLEELKKELGTIVVQAAASLTGKILTPDDQRRMAEETIRHFAKAA